MISYNFIGCLLLASRLCTTVESANQFPLNKLTAFTSTRRSHCRRRSYKHGAFQLQAQLTKQKNPLLELKSGQDFDDDLVNDIQDALASAGVAGIDFDDSKDLNGYTTSKNEESQIENKTTDSFPKTPPPHTALAQVLANQYNINLASVSPSAKGPGSKITAEDVEFHAWKVSQPPCTEEALMLAHSLELDLNDLYDDEDREYVMQLSDVELFQENESSLKMVVQTRKGINDEDMTESSRKRMKKVKALDKRMEQNVGKLAQNFFAFAGTVTSGIMEQVQSETLKASEKLKEAGLFMDIDGKSADEIKGVEDFDSILANEIQEALSCADFHQNIAGEPATSSTETNGEATDVIKAMEDFDSNLASEIQEALSSANLDDSNVVEPAASSTETNGEVTDMIKAMEGFDMNLASEIQEALSSASLKDCDAVELSASSMDINGEMTDDVTTAENIDTDVAREIQEALPSASLENDNAVEPAASCMDVNGEISDDAKAVEDVDINLASEIREALSSASLEDTNAVEPSVSSADAIAINLTSEIQETSSSANLENSIAGEPPASDFEEEMQPNAEDSNAVEPVLSYTKEELQSLTVVKLKNKLRRLGMKLSGRKAELVDRLFGANVVNDAKIGNNSTDQISESYLFFAASEGNDDK